MNTLIVYASVHHGNTRKIASAIAEAVQGRLVSTEEAHGIRIDSFDCIGFGSGIFYGKHQRALLQIVDELPVGTNKKAFVFSTSGSGSKRSNKGLEEALQKKSFTVIGSFACKGYDTWGPLKWVGGLAKNRPNRKDLEEAQNFVKKICM